MLTVVVVVHPVEDDLWSAVPATDHVARHFLRHGPGQTKVQDLGTAETVREVIRTTPGDSKDCT